MGTYANAYLCEPCSQKAGPGLIIQPCVEEGANRKLEGLVAGDHWSKVKAYEFVLESVWVSLMMAGRFWNQGHISGRSLLEVLRVMARLRFGLQAKATLNGWGVRTCEDFGEIVFNLVNCGMLGKQPEDRREDFCGGYSFDEAFPKS